jgi:sporulation protein YlmC with PRC-barrel domain
MKSTVLKSLALCVTGCLLTGTAIARQASTDPGQSGTTTRPGYSSNGSGKSMQGQKEQRLSQLMGATVKGQDGQTLGQITDFIVQPSFGRIQFAVISLSDQSGKLTAIPWQLVQTGAEATSVTLNVDKQKVASAQTFDASTWPDFTQSGWSHEVYAYYGIQAPGRMGGRIHTGGVETGSGTSQQPTYPNQQPQQPPQSPQPQYPK